jgi:hypothetical protein
MGIPSCRLQLDGDQALKNSEFTQLHWAAPAAYVTNDRVGSPAEVYDPEGMFDPSQPEYLTVRVDGVYRAWLCIKFGDRDTAGKTRRTGRRAVAVQMNDGNPDILISVGADPGGTTSLPAGIDLPLRAGDRLSVWLEQQSGATIYAVGHSSKDSGFGLSWERSLA